MQAYSEKSTTTKVLILVVLLESCLDSVKVRVR